MAKKPIPKWIENLTLALVICAIAVGCQFGHQLGESGAIILALDKGVQTEFAAIRKRLATLEDDLDKAEDKLDFADLQFKLLWGCIL